MDAIIALGHLLFGFIPLLSVVALSVAILWMITKIFPRFGAQLSATYDMLMGVNEDYDAKHRTGYHEHPRRWN